MFRRSSDEGLTLELNGHSYRFQSPQDLEFALGGRTGLPPAKIAALMQQTDDALLREAEGIRSVEQRFADALSGMLEDVTSISPFLKELDMTLISQDHDWRLIMAALNGTGRTYEEFKKVALVKYMQYLTARQEVIKSVFASRQALAQSNLRAEKGASQAEAQEKFRDTLIFDLNDGARDDSLYRSFSRIPKGETVEICLEPDDEVEILLAQHRCAVVNKNQLIFVDEQGESSVLSPGKNIVGRDLSSDIVINPGLRDISRKHLIIETEGTLVRLTDISSHGTSVPPELLENTSI